MTIEERYSAREEMQREYEAPGDLIVLCKTCHERHHAVLDTEPPF